MSIEIVDYVSGLRYEIWDAQIADEGYFTVGSPRQKIYPVLQD